MRMKLSSWILCLCFIAICPMEVIPQARASENNSAVITVTVTVTKDPCIINENRMIDVDFGNNVVVTDVAAGLVHKAIDYTLDCGDSDPDKTLVLGISGNGAEFDDTLLGSSIPELGIEITANGTKLPLNDKLELSGPTDKPELEAILRQALGSHLPTGEFTAGATMTVLYQ